MFVIIVNCAFHSLKLLAETHRLHADITITNPTSILSALAYTTAQPVMIYLTSGVTCCL